MKKSELICYIAAFWLGATIDIFTGMSYANWQFWVICAPAVTLFCISSSMDK